MLTLPIDQEVEMRVLQPEHAEELFELLDKNREFLSKWIPWIHEVPNLEAAEKFIEQGQIQYLSNRSFQAGIWYKGKMAGCLSFHPIEWRHHRTSIGYWLGEGFQGKGIVTRAVIRAINYTFDELNLNRLEIRCGVENEPSQAIPKRLNFKEEGVLRGAEWVDGRYQDHVVYGLLRHEWQRMQLDHPEFL